MSEWYADHGHLAEFVRHLAKEERFTGEQVAAVVEKPWKWTEEYEAFVSAAEGDDHER